MRKLPSVYSEVRYGETNSILFDNDEKEEILKDSNLFVVEDVPDYLKIDENPIPAHIKRMTIKQYSGFLIDFKDTKTLDQYLKLRFGKSSRYKLKRDKRKLEHCFDITYKMYYGAISKEDYDNVFYHLYRLLEFRSYEKGINDNINFKERELYQSITYSMILERKASLFVIYNKDQPIDICLNFHLENLIYQHIRTYDIAYGKFNTGYTDLIMQIKWCIENNVLAMVFSKGDYYWKRRWCNTVYDYYFHIYYKKNNLLSTVLAYRVWLLRLLRQKARELGIIEKYHNYKNEKIKKRNLKEEPNLKVCDCLNENEFSNWDLLDYKLADVFTRRIINNFLYESNQNQSEIKVFSSKGNTEDLFIKGVSESVLYKITPPTK